MVVSYKLVVLILSMDPTLHMVVVVVNSLVGKILVVALSVRAEEKSTEPPDTEKSLGTSSELW